jgi:hypothetical protein
VKIWTPKWVTPQRFNTSGDEYSPAMACHQDLIQDLEDFADRTVVAMPQTAYQGRQFLDTSCARSGRNDAGAESCNAGCLLLTRLPYTLDWLSDSTKRRRYRNEEIQYKTRIWLDRGNNIVAEDGSTADLQYRWLR